MTTVYIVLILAAEGLLAGLPGWLALRRTGRLTRRADEHETVIEDAVGRRQGSARHGRSRDEGRRKRHLRIVGLWLGGAGAWLLSRARLHPGRVAVVTLTAASVTVAALVAGQPPTAPPASVGQPRPHLTATTRPPGADSTGTPPASTRRPTSRTGPTSIVTRTVRPTAPTTIRQTATTTAAPTSTATEPTSAPTTTTMPAPIAGPACLLVGPIIQLDLTTCLAAVLGD